MGGKVLHITQGKYLVPALRQIFTFAVTMVKMTLAQWRMCTIAAIILYVEINT